MKVPEISVIVPVYNCAVYLPRCLDSLRGQLFKDIEIIAVNDGSTDNSLEVLRQFSRREPRLRIINQEKNCGVSHTRNAGIAVADGKYLSFIDADDTVDKNFYYRLYRAAKQSGSEIAACGIRSVSGKMARCQDYILDECAEPEAKFRALFNGSVCNKIYHRNLFVKHSLSFMDGVMLEDNLFTLQAFYYAAKVIFIDRTYYNYFFNSGSITQNNIYRAKRRRDSLIIAAAMAQFAAAHMEKPVIDTIQAQIIRWLVYKPDLLYPSYFRELTRIVGDSVFLRRLRWQSLRRFVWSFSWRRRRLTIFGINIFG